MPPTTKLTCQVKISEINRPLLIVLIRIQKCCAISSFSYQKYHNAYTVVMPGSYPLQEEHYRLKSY